MNIQISFNAFMLGIGIILFIMFLMSWSYLLGKYYERSKKEQEK